MGLLKVLFIFVLVLFPLGEVARFQFNNGVAVTANDLGVGVLIIAWLITAIRKKRKFLNDPIKKPILVFIFLGFLSLLVNSRILNQQELIISSLYLIRWSFYAGLFFIVTSFDSEFKKKIPYYLLLTGILTVLIGYLQYFFYPALRNLLYLGWDEHLYRMFSVFFDPNFAGIIFVLTLLLMTGIFFGKKAKSLWLVPVALIVVIAVFLTYSRSSMIMLVVSLSTFLVLIGRKKWLVGAAVFFVVMMLTFSQFYKSEGTNLLRTTSSYARLGSAENALLVFKENPVFGVGFNAYRYAQHRIGLNTDTEWKFSHGGAGADNSFLFVLATTGIVGFVSYLYLWFKIIVEQKKRKTVLSNVVIASSLGLFIASFFINSLFYPFIMEWMWILVALKESK